MATPLRTAAEASLAEGSAPHSEVAPISIEALRLLHRLANSPTSAEDALLLLHELQVHQVELDLQLAQVLANEQQLADDLALYKELYERAPAGYFRLAPDGRIIEANRAGAQLLGVEQDLLVGRRIEGFVAVEFQRTLADLLERLRSRGTEGSCAMQIAGRDGGPLAVQAAADAAADGSLLLLFVDISGREP